MALIKTVNNTQPQWGQDCFFAENATLVGDVVMGDECSVWFQAVVRGDVNSIRLGNRVNIQDGAIIHCTFERSSTHIGSHVSVGHQAIVHGCRIHDDVLVGMGSRIMDHAVVESGCIIAAGAVILENTICESGYIYAGVPARKIKPVSPELLEGEIRRIANNYVRYASWYK
ncbi:gamma carbonic anhydrase family protein [Membranicola marinus]|uniref:Gamma carbonic anhydrase family protein n=1 Tax=Membranihabitans marinus TaxID=1227546 RepID=A0A953LBW9_9BACT|nr:gamma carbonic anhydrase family protein [Membranihabitans marinus]MBY5960208.1 gamma carbonic anhydrase family protein [Membranihabitans marinus]